MQFAHKILRQCGGVRQYTPHSDGSDQARVEGLHVLARSGKLKDLIARAEAQLASSPSSQQALQSLVDYYHADNQREKVKETYRRFAGLRPHDAKLLFQIGLQLARNGAAVEASEHFKSAVPKDPPLIVSAYSKVQNAFQLAKKTDDLVKLYESVDFKGFNSNPVRDQSDAATLPGREDPRPGADALPQGVEGHALGPGQPPRRSIDARDSHSWRSSAPRMPGPRRPRPP